VGPRRTTDLDNLALVCPFHHKLVHEHGWRLSRDADGTARWFHPDETPYREGTGKGRIRGDRATCGRSS
jgi:hypothetical protein